MLTGCSYESQISIVSTDINYAKHNYNMIMSCSEVEDVILHFAYCKTSIRFFLFQHYLYVLLILHKFWQLEPLGAKKNLGRES